MWDILKKMRRFDAYPKTLEDVRIQTYTGGAITIISIIIMNLLFWSEFLNYVTPDITEELFVDTSRSPKIQINLDFVIPKISCDFLALDAMDSSGEQHLEMDHNIYKRRLDLDGKPIADPDKVNITVSKNTTQSNNKTECGSCYGAADRCCNTCEDVKEAYREKKWALDNIESIEQCKNEKYSEKLKTAFLQGCQIYGSLIVNRVSGSFHIAPGESFSVSHLHVHDVQPFSSNDFNTSHRIRHLSFGDRIESHTHNPLKDLEVYANEGSTMFQYYIKIVPTAYIRKDGSIISSNQYSVTKHQKVVSMISGESGMPGIFFQYELSPLMVKYTEKERSFGHFITNLCAIIGGVYTVAGLLDTVVYYFVKMMQRNTSLGKFS